MQSCTHGYRHTTSIPVHHYILFALICAVGVVGVSLKLQGVIIPNNSLVDITDILYIEPNKQIPHNTHPLLHDQALLCITDLEDCCRSSLRGNWYYPNGNVVEFDTDGKNSAFWRNRGQNEVIADRHFYGSVCLFRKDTPPERGQFCCKLPDASNSSQTLCVYICEFISFSWCVHLIIQIMSFSTVNIEEVNFSPSRSNSGNPGDDFSLNCSATISGNPLPSYVPLPTFEWYSGPNGNVSLPSGVTPVVTVLNSGSSTYTITSTLLFSPLSQFHAGMYTCRAGTKRLGANITVNCMHYTLTRYTSLICVHLVPFHSSSIHHRYGNC